MNTEELYNETLSRLPELPTRKIHPLHKAMLEECCEKVLEDIDKPENSDFSSKMNDTTKMVMVAFHTCMSLMQATLRGAIEGVNADQVTLNYRDQTFVIKKTDNILKPIK